MYLVCSIYISGCVRVGDRELGGRGVGRGEGIWRGMWGKKDIYIKVLSTGDVFYSRVYMFYVYLSSDCKVLCNN